MHLSPEMALDLIERQSDESERDFWNAHLQGCGDCRGQMDGWNGFHLLMRRPHLQDAPLALVRAAEGIFQRPAATRRSVIREAIAALAFDSFAQPALAGARGAAAAARQMVLRTEEFDIHLRISGAGAQRKLTGQVLSRLGGKTAESAKLHLLCGEERWETAVADNFGEFEFGEVPEGSLNLQVDLPNLTIVSSLDIEEKR